MADTLSKVRRSEVMSKIRSHGNKETEIALTIIFRRYKITGWRRNQLVFGKPDFIFKKHNLAVFVDGCFWHGCRRCFRAPKSNRQFWRQKIARNRKRDVLVTRFLRTHGWKVLRIWQCDLRLERRIVKRLKIALRRQ